MLENQVRWLNDNGGMAWATARCAQSAVRCCTQWAEKSANTPSPFVADESARSNAVVTVDLDERDQRHPGGRRAARERHRGHRPDTASSGRNQLRIGVFPSVEPSDVDCAHPLHRLCGRTPVTAQVGYARYDSLLRSLIPGVSANPHPKPVRVDLRKVFTFGTALVGHRTDRLHRYCLRSASTPSDAQTVCAAGTVIGVLMLVWEHFDRWDYRRLGE